MDRPRWESEFGEGYACPPCPEGWRDESFRKDLAPRYVYNLFPDERDSAKPTREVCIWMDHPSPWKRDLCGKRFAVDSLEVWEEFDSWDEALDEAEDAIRRNGGEV